MTMQTTLEHLPFSSGFAIKCTVRNNDHTVEEELATWKEIVHALVEQVQILLEEELERNTLVTLFDFPLPVRTACEQYLLYFGQFLRDIGIEAETDLRHRAGQVLFSVKPQAGAEALNKIREALDLYLQVPGAPDFDDVAAAHSDVAVMQLQANVHHLKGQLAIAGAVLRARDAEVEALRLSNFQYRQLLAATSEVDLVAERLMEPRHVDNKETENEEILGGFVTVTPYEGKGFTLDLPALLRSLKRRFGWD